MSLDLNYSAQDVTRCALCETPIPETFCDYCHVNLCKSCIADHIADEYERHKIVSFDKRKRTLIYPKCETHQIRTCEYQCKDCDNTFVCYSCTASKQHKGHEFLELSEISYAKKEHIQKDLDELENIIFPTHEDIASENQIASLDEEYENVKSEMSKQGEELHRAIDIVINQMEKEISEIKVKHLALLKTHLDDIKHIQDLLQQTLVDLNDLEESNKVYTIIQYSTNDTAFNKNPPKVKVTMTKFIPKHIESKKLKKFLGELISFSVNKPISTNSATEPNNADIDSSLQTMEKCMPSVQIVE